MKDGAAYNNYLVMYPGEHRIELIRTPWIDSTAINIKKSDLVNMKNKFKLEGWSIVDKTKEGW